MFSRLYFLKNMTCLTNLYLDSPIIEPNDFVYLIDKPLKYVSIKNSQLQPFSTDFKAKLFYALPLQVESMYLAFKEDLRK